MKKILVIGTSGSGKSTLAKRLSELLDIQFFPSDHFYWESGWKLVPSEKVFEQVKNVVSQKQWILDGNFEAERELVWKQADCIVWLDYSLAIILKQVATRNFTWLLTRQSTWSGNRMTFQRAISGIRHTAKTYSMKKESYPSWLAELDNVKVHRFCKKQDTENWLKGLRQ
ncbi:MAG: AAA family ATPase [Anaerolineales bacterium]|nr:AAA family ATPase [Anaerolineales bacterium]